jgi:hypothetical protein
MKKWLILKLYDFCCWAQIKTESNQSPEHIAWLKTRHLIDRTLISISLDKPNKKK